MHEKHTENCLSAAPATALFWDNVEAGLEPTHPSRHPTPHLLQTTYSPAGTPESHCCACLSAAQITTPTRDCMNFEPGFQVRTSRPNPPTPHQSATPISQRWDRVNPNPESQLGPPKDSPLACPAAYQPPHSSAGSGTKWCLILSSRAAPRQKTSHYSARPLVNSHFDPYVFGSSCVCHP